MFNVNFGIDSSLTLLLLVSFVGVLFIREAHGHSAAYLLVFLLQFEMHNFILLYTQEVKKNLPLVSC